MKSWMKENKFIVLSVVIILSLAFYWYEWRPSKIRAGCYAEAEFDKRAWQLNVGSEERNKFIDSYYLGCLKKFGLEK